MGVFDEDELRAIIADEIGKAINRLLADQPRAGGAVEQYLSVADAAGIAAVAPATIRAWMGAGRLARYHAGRELRVRRAELEALLRTNPSEQDGRERSPETEADRFFQRRHQRVHSGIRRS